MVAVFPLTLFAIAFVYWKLNMKNLCHQWEQNNHSIPLSVLECRLIGDETEDIVMNLWFPATLALLFDWMEFKLNHFSTLFIGFDAVGTTGTNFKSLFLNFSIYPKNDYLEYIANGIFPSPGAMRRPKA